MSNTHYCKCCRGIRENNGVICIGCGTPLISCRVTKQKKTRIDCPAFSSSGPHRQLEPGRMTCVKCNGIFEGGDVGYLDDRPDVNAEKRERQERIDLERRRKAR